MKPNDGECHLNDYGEYTHSTFQDYPSISQVNLKVRQNAINVIFAVTSEQIGVYERLKDHVEGASSGKLSNDSSNVVDLVREQYDVSKIIQVFYKMEIYFQLRLFRKLLFQNYCLSKICIFINLAQLRLF